MERAGQTPGGGGSFWTMAAVTALGAVAIGLLALGYFDWRRFEGTHPEEEWGRGPALLRFTKQLLRMLVEAVVNGIIGQF